MLLKTKLYFTMQSSSNLSTSQYRYFTGIREPFYKCEYLKADDTAFSYDCYSLKLYI